MNNKCHFCGHTGFKQASVQYIYRHNNRFLIVNDVPCEQCEHCGEQYFSGHVLRSIEAEFERLHYKGKKAKKKIHVPVEVFAEMELAY